MLIILFAIAALILITSIVRPSSAIWARVAVALAGILMLAVLVAWGIEYLAQRA